MGNLFWDYAVFTIARLISEFSVLIKVDIFCEISFVYLTDISRTNLRWKFRKILRPSQNIWTLPTHVQKNR